MERQGLSVASPVLPLVPGSPAMSPSSERRTAVRVGWWRSPDAHLRDSGTHQQYHRMSHSLHHVPPPTRNTHRTRFRRVIVPRGVLPHRPTQNTMRSSALREPGGQGPTGKDPTDPPNLSSSVTQPNRRLLRLLADCSRRLRAPAPRNPCSPRRGTAQRGVRKAFPAETNADRESQRDTTDDGSNAISRTSGALIPKCSWRASYVSAS